FLPSPGQITALTEPSGPGVRLDSGVFPGWVVPLEYDPLLAKLAVWAETREAALERARRALAEYSVSGIRTNIAFFRDILDDPEFRSGRLHTGFIEEFFRRRPALSGPDEETLQATVLAAALSAIDRRKESATPQHGASRWAEQGRGALLR
ncbi:MAG: acetyl-CoA carboxylase biotin carboxylase subunit, partial [bacterium]